MQVVIYVTMIWNEIQAYFRTCFRMSSIVVFFTSPKLCLILLL